MLFVASINKEQEAIHNGSIDAANEAFLPKPQPWPMSVRPAPEP